MRNLRLKIADFRLWGRLARTLALPFLMAVQTFGASGLDKSIRIQSGPELGTSTWSQVTIEAGTNLLAGSLTASNVAAAKILVTDSASKLVAATNTGSGSVVMDQAPTIASPTITGTPVHPDGSIARADLADAAAVSVIGRSANSSGVPADIAASANNQVLMRSNNAVVFQAVSGSQIQDGSVALADQADLATQRVIGRNTAGTGVPEAVTAAQILAWIGSTRGSVLYYGASGWTILTPGTSGQVLKTAGAGADPSWGADDTGGTGISGTVINTGTPVQYALPRYSDTTGTNVGPSSLLTDGTGTNFYAGGFLIDTLTVTNPIPVTSGGLGIASGTSGGVPYFSGGTTIASSAALAANAIVVGGGAGAAPSTITTASGINTFIGTPSSANLASAITDESGNGGGFVRAQNAQRTLTTSPGAADDTWAGIAFSGQNNSGGVTQWDAVYMNGSSQWVLADANGSGTFPCRGLAVATATTGNAVTVIEDGVVRNDAWTWTPGGTIYLSTTAGALTQTAPSTTGDKVQVIGYAIDADTMRVKISADYGTAP